MAPAYTISHLAYLKLVLHAAKHPHAPVNGVLLTSSPLSAPEILISDSIPLLHHWTSLSPMMEIGLDLAEGYAVDNNMRLVGYYEASERAQDTSIGPVGDRVLAKLKGSNADAVAFVLDASSMAEENAGLIPFVANPTLRAVQEPPPFTEPPPSQSEEGSSPSGTKSSTPSFHLVSETSPSRTLTAIRDRHLQRSFGDFDDHLEDVTIDWLRNPKITSEAELG